MMSERVRAPYRGDITGAPLPSGDLFTEEFLETKIRAAQLSSIRLRRWAAQFNLWLMMFS